MEKTRRHLIIAMVRALRSFAFITGLAILIAPTVAVSEEWVCPMDNQSSGITYWQDGANYFVEWVDGGDYIFSLTTGGTGDASGALDGKTITLKRTSGANNARSIDWSDKKQWPTLADGITVAARMNIVDVSGTSPQVCLRLNSGNDIKGVWMYVGNSKEIGVVNTSGTLLHSHTVSTDYRNAWHTFTISAKTEGGYTYWDIAIDGALQNQDQAAGAYGNHFYVGTSSGDNANTMDLGTRTKNTNASWKVVYDHCAYSSGYRPTWNGNASVTNVTSDKANGYYKAGEVIDIKVVFSQKVDVTGTPQLQLETGTVDQQVNYYSGSGTNTLVFRYTVQSGDTSGDLDYKATSSLALNGGTIRTGGLDAALTLPSPGGTASLGYNKNLVIDTTAPTVTINQAAGQADPTPTSPINFTVVFSESLSDFATGDVSLSGTAGATTGTVSGGGTTYNVAASGMTTSGTVIATILVDKAHDAAGNGNTASTSTDNTVTYNSDSTPPTVSNVTSDKANGAYKAGEVINIQVVFSENVNVTGTPRIELETGDTNRQVNYSSGSGTSTLTFAYTVQAGDTSSDLDYTGTGALTLNGGTIKDGAGNSAVLTLFSPGASGSLAYNKNLVIDTDPPSTPVVTDDGDYTTSTTQIHASWTATDSGSNIAEYQYAVSTTQTEVGIITGGGWESVGTATEDTRTDLSLAYDQTYYVLVKAKDGAGGWSAIGVSDGITVIATEGVPPLSITNLGLGGGDWGDPISGLGQKGIAGASGLNNIGLLVRIWGNYTYVNSSKFEVDDGSGVSVECVMPTGISAGPSWEYVIVTGISSCYKDVDENLHRRVLVRKKIGHPDEADISHIP